MPAGHEVMATRFSTRVLIRFSALGSFATLRTTSRLSARPEAVKSSTHSAAHSATHAAAAVRDHLPRLGLLVDREHCDGVPLINARLFLHAVEIGSHTIPELTSAHRVAGLSEPHLRGVHRRAERATASLRPTRDGGQSYDLGVSKIELAAVGEEQLRRGRACATSGAIRLAHRQ